MRQPCISTLSDSTSITSQWYSTSPIVLAAAGIDIPVKSTGSSSPPTLNEEMILGVQNRTLLLIQHGLG